MSRVFRNTRRGRVLNNERGMLSLLGLLLALVIIAILYYQYMGSHSAKTPAKTSAPGVEDLQTTPGKAIERAHDVECQSNLRTIRASINMARDDQGAPPASIKDIKVGTANPNFFKCTVGGEDYAYNPQDGTIRCPHPGHEGY